MPGHVDEALTIEAVLSHTATGSYRYEPARFAVVADVMAQCGGDYSSSLADEILSRFAMIDSVPGGDVLDSSQRDQFSSGQLDRYESAFQRLAAPYRIDDRGRATRSAYVTPPTNPATSVVASVLDLAKFDLALRDGLLLSQDTLRLAWLPVAGGPAGLGWLIQRVGSDTVVWQYGVETDAYSSLMIKVPGRDLTLILLANSDRLAAPHATAVPDVTASVFAKLFFRTFLV